MCKTKMVFFYYDIKNAVRHCWETIIGNIICSKLVRNIRVYYRFKSGKPIYPHLSCGDDGLPF